MHHFIILFTATRKVTYLNSVILCHVLNGEQWTRTKTKSKQIKPNRSWSFFFRIVFFLFLWASCLLLLLVEWVCTTLFFLIRCAITPCVIVHRTETKFGMLASFFGMNKILVLLEVATYCFIMVSDGLYFICFALFCLYCFRFRWRFRMRFRWTEAKQPISRHTIYRV